MDGTEARGEVFDGVFDALGNPTRRAILGYLAEGARPVGDIAAQFPVSRPAISRHLKVLCDAGLVRYTEDGTRHLFEVDRQGFLVARAWLDGFWAQALSAFSREAEESWTGGER